MRPVLVLHASSHNTIDLYRHLYRQQSTLQTQSLAQLSELYLQIHPRIYIRIKAQNTTHHFSL